MFPFLQPMFPFCSDITRPKRSTYSFIQITFPENFPGQTHQTVHIGVAEFKTLPSIFFYHSFAFARFHPFRPSSLVGFEGHTFVRSFLRLLVENFVRSLRWMAKLVKFRWPRCFSGHMVNRFPLRTLIGPTECQRSILEQCPRSSIPFLPPSPPSCLLFRNFPGFVFPALCSRD
ncbi:hypothetical protein CEXT_591351 [Caerostris extrusa]|uniref:Uncharacterized protein n=1 Tax=Caerostris extrusa TaxID=172846 RepID=A0AAV4UB25_CAEEX|nr:hypothetical protein CEXT_591351 [Caerostris extrusa]